VSKIMRQLCFLDKPRTNSYHGQINLWAFRRYIGDMISRSWTSARHTHSGGQLLVYSELVSWNEFPRVKFKSKVYQPAVQPSRSADEDIVTTEADHWKE
jgi:hypothetical protein